MMSGPAPLDGLSAHAPPSADRLRGGSGSPICARRDAAGEPWHRTSDWPEGIKASAMEKAPPGWPHAYLGCSKATSSGPTASESSGTIRRVAPSPSAW